jgi:hypothetical protein
MHDIAEAIEFIAASQLLLSFLDGSGHTKTKAAAVVNLNIKHLFEVEKLEGVRRQLFKVLI